MTSPTAFDHALETQFLIHYRSLVITLLGSNKKQASLFHVLVLELPPTMLTKKEAYNCCTFKNLLLKSF